MFTLVIGNYNYSSWSLRAWLVLKRSGLAFDTVRVVLDQPDTARNIARYTPAGRVPVLIHDDLHVWDSLAICEYLAEQAPQAGLWPADPRARALARSVSAEMHAGFEALRMAMPMNCRARARRVPETPALALDIDRVLEVWRDCRARWGAHGPWLFGHFSIADAMYAPVVSRFRTYGVDADDIARAYGELWFGDGDFRQWLELAGAEPEVLPDEEVGGR